MFSIKQKREIADAVQKSLRATNHPELSKDEIKFSLHVEGSESWSWADIKNNGSVIEPISTPRMKNNMTPKIGDRFVEIDPRIHRVVQVTKIGSVENGRFGKVQLNGTNRSWARVSRFYGGRIGYLPAVECQNCTTGTPTESKRWLRENCHQCKGTGWVSAKKSAP